MQDMGDGPASTCTAANEYQRMLRLQWGKVGGTSWSNVSELRLKVIMIGGLLLDNTESI